ASNETGDTLSGRDTAIFQILDRELDTGVQPQIEDLRDAWLARGLPAAAFGRLYTLNGIPFLRNHGAIANAGPDLVANEGSTVTLNGSGSEDPELSTMGFGWTQTGGPTVSLNGSNLATATFTAPSVSQSGAVLTFRLAVS